MFLIGLNPIKGYGSMCGDKWLYPLGFMIMVCFQILIMIMLLRILRTKEVLKVKGKDVEDYYNHIQDNESPFNINEMLEEQTKLISKELKCVLTLNSIIVVIKFIHFDFVAVAKYREEEEIACSANGFTIVSLKKSYMGLVGFVAHMMLVMFPIKSFIKIFYKIPSKYNYFESV